jgi:TRAP-type uncharacterized transport system substrate-binding protein
MVAAQQSLTIATGKPKGGYAAYTAILSDRLSQYKVPNKVINYNGSNAIATALCSKEAALGVLQIDALYNMSKQGCALEPLAIYGTEYAMILFPPDSEYDSLGDLGEGDKVLVDGVGSGSELTLQTMIAIEKGPDGNNSTWSKLSLVNGGFETAPASASAGLIDAVFMVAKQDNSRLIALLDQDWVIGDVSDKDIDDLLFNKKPLYDKTTINLNRNWFGGADNGSAYAIRSIVAGAPGWRTLLPEQVAGVVESEVVAATMK